MLLVWSLAAWLCMLLPTTSSPAAAGGLIEKVSAQWLIPIEGSRFLRLVRVTAEQSGISTLTRDSHTNATVVLRTERCKRRNGLLVCSDSEERTYFGGSLQVAPDASTASLSFNDQGRVLEVWWVAGYLPGTYGSQDQCNGQDSLSRGIARGSTADGLLGDMPLPKTSTALIIRALRAGSC